MEAQHVMLLWIAILLILGVAAVAAAWYFGRQYQAGGGKQRKYACVACSVAACVCIITAIQILWMFRHVW